MAHNQVPRLHKTKEEAHPLVPIPQHPINLRYRQDSVNGERTTFLLLPHCTKPHSEVGRLDQVQSLTSVASSDLPNEEAYFLAVRREILDIRLVDFDALKS